MTRIVPLGRVTPPRGLLILASLWLGASWILLLGFRPPVQAQSASYTPGVRLMLLSMAAGISLAWPLVRLSGPMRPKPALQALLDLAVLLCLVQVVLWPLRLVTPWPPARAAALDLCLAGWGLAFAAIVAAGSGPGPQGTLAVRRTLAMVAAVSLAAGAPLLVTLGGGALPFTDPAAGGRLAAWSPGTALWSITAAGFEPPSGAEWKLAATGTAVALFAWLSLGIARIVSRPATAR